MSFLGPGSGVLRYSRIAGIVAAAVMVAAGSLASLAGSPQATATVKPEEPPPETLTMPPEPPGGEELIILYPQPAQAAPYWLLPPPAGG
jgi:hypothetical protein